MKRPIKLEVGGKYRTRGGDVVAITERHPGMVEGHLKQSWPFFGGVLMSGPERGLGLTWSPDGRRFYDYKLNGKFVSRKDSNDLVGRFRTRQRGAGNWAAQ